jgi:sporulation inhibitor KapD
MTRDFFVVDFEFTQYTKPTGRPMSFFSEIIEIGAEKINGKTLDVVGKIHNFVHPHFYPKLAKEIMEFCMITDKDMQTAIEFVEMIEKIKELYIPRQTYFAAWSDADYYVLEEGCNRHGIENPVLFEDYLDMAAWYKWEMDDDYTTGLRKATEEQCIDTGLLWHTAIDDAANTGKLLVQLLNDGFDPEDFIIMSIEREKKILERLTYHYTKQPELRDKELRDKLKEDDAVFAREAEEKGEFYEPMNASRALIKRLLNDIEI